MKIMISVLATALSMGVAKGVQPVVKDILPKPDKVDKSLFITDLALVSADALMTPINLGNGCIETNSWMYGVHPSALRSDSILYGQFVGVQLASRGLAGLGRRLDLHGHRHLGLVSKVVGRGVHVAFDYQETYSLVENSKMMVDHSCIHLPR